MFFGGDSVIGKKDDGPEKLAEALPLGGKAGVFSPSPKYFYHAECRPLSALYGG